MKFNCAKLSPELPCVSARGRTIETESSEEREYRWKRKRRLQVENIRSNKRDGSKLAFTLRYIIEIAEITREDIYVTAKGADGGREWRSKSLSTVSGISVASYLRVLSGTGEILWLLQPVAVSPVKRRVDGPFLLVAAH